MKTHFKFTLLFFLAIFSFQGCEDMDDNVAPNAAPIDLEVQDFIWKGLNFYYLWKYDVPTLLDDRFANQAEFNNFLKKYPIPENLFDALLFKPKDRFSWIVKDYRELEQALGGISKNHGAEYGLVYKPGSNTEIFGYVRYILPNSDAIAKEIQRGTIFYGINGTQLTVSNYKYLLGTDNYTLNLADYNAGAITPNGKSVAMTKTVLAENPILINKVITSGTHKIGYLMYNGFYAEYDSPLNDAFGTLKSQGVTDLVLDLRYNSGGSVQTAARLASMITQQTTDKVFAKQEWNKDIMKLINENNLKNLFVDKIESTPINCLNMTTIYILTSKSSASASELIINGLKPYMNVVQIGDVTYGKNVGSVTIYDSPSLTKNNVNPNHYYAMQPIVLKIVNADGFGDYTEGLTPTYQLKEDFGNLDVLGNTTEPLLSTAIGKITGTGKMLKQSPEKDFNYFKDAKSIDGLQNQMYIDKAPEGLLKALK